MFGRFTWGDFTEFLLLVTLSYYVLIIYFFYRKDFHQFLFPFVKAEAIEPAGLSNQLLLVHELVSELGVVIRSASNNETTVPELLFALQTKVKDYLALETTEYKAKINLYITEELEIHGFHAITVEQIENLWKS